MKRKIFKFLIPKDLQPKLSSSPCNDVVLRFLLLTLYFTSFSGVSAGNFEQANDSWEPAHNTVCSFNINSVICTSSVFQFNSCIYRFNSNVNTVHLILANLI